MSELDEQADELKAAIAGLEAQRSLLGKTVVEPALAALRQQLSEIDSSQTDLASDDERKIVTVLFVDVSGFTALLEKLDPEEVRSLINTCFECLVPIVQKYQGTVDKFIGDEIMALFGAPVAHENDPERALRAALELMDAIATFNREHATELDLHIGVNTGPVIAGKIGSQDRRDYSVIGDAVNLAARLEDASADGQIYVGANTYRQTARIFDFETLLPLKLKGKTEPVEIYRLIGLKAAPRPIRGIEGLHAPLIGRDSELEEIRSALRAVREGSGGIRAIIGEAGLGKSRLVAEALQSFAADVTWAEGRALSYGAGMSYWMARDVLHGLLGVKAETRPEKIGMALRNGVEHTLPNNLADVYPYLARLLDVPLQEAMEERVKFLTSEALQGHILQAFRDYVHARAAQEPLILFWEDLHWCDPSSLSVLEMLLPLTREVPLLLLLAYRPDEDLLQKLQEQSRAAGAEKYRSIQLVPLTREQSGSLIHRLLKIENFSEKMRELILDRAEGNPFFLEELLRSLLDAGIVIVEPDRIVATRVIESVDIPETLQGVLMARIDRLTPEKKSALQNAAVIGRVFQYRVLAHLYEEKSNTNKRLDDSLAELQRREFVQSRAQEPSEEREYIFKHAITHDVAYNSLLIARRKELHKRTAEAIEVLFPDRLDELSATLGYHFERAEAREKAIRYLRQAAERAQATFANTEAIAFYRSAIAQIKPLLEDKKDHDGATVETAARLHEGLGDVLKLAGQQDETRDAYGCALSLSPKTDRIRRSRLYRKIGSSYVIQRRYEETSATFDAAEKELGGNATEPVAEWWSEKVQIQMERMHLFYWQGMAKEMMRLAEEQRALVEEKARPIQRGMFFLILALSRLTRDRYVASEEALNFAQIAVAASKGATDASDLSQLSHIQFVLGFIHLWRGNLATAAEQIQVALKTAEKVGDAVIQVRCLTYLAVGHRRSHHIAETRHHASLAWKQALETKMVEYIAMAKASLAWVAWREANSSEVRTQANEALELWHQMADPYGFDWMALLPLIAVASAEGNIAEAIEYVRGLFGENQHPLPKDLTAIAKQAIGSWEKKEVAMAMTKLDQVIELSKKLGYL
jgi:class 3 adenylate cyclase/predicted ATPase